MFTSLKNGLLIFVVLMSFKIVAMQRQGDETIRKQLLAAASTGNLAQYRKIMEQNRLRRGTIHGGLQCSAIRDESGNTPLLLAAIIGNIEMVHYLLEGHDCSLRDINRDAKNNIVHVAAYFGHLELLQFLYNYNPTIFTQLNLQANIGGHYPINGAAVNGYLEVVLFLLSIEDAQGKLLFFKSENVHILKSALELAKLNKHDAIIQELISVISLVNNMQSQSSPARTKIVQQAQRQPERPAIPPAALSKPTEVVKAPVGFTNPDSRCFMNGALQGLASLPELSNILSSVNDQSFKPNSRGLLIARLLQQAQTATQAIDNRQFCVRSSYRFKEGTAEDSGEFLRLAIQSLISDTTSPDLQQLLRELLTLEIQYHTQSGHLHKTDQIVPQMTLIPGSTIPQLFYNFLDEQNALIVRASQYLILEVKRQVQEAGKEVTKVDPTPFPLQGFNIRTYCMPEAECPASYRLTAIVFHSGGHYLAIARRGNAWFVVDDTNVRPISQAEIERIAAQGQMAANVVPTIFFYQSEQ